MWPRLAVRKGKMRERLNLRLKGRSLVVEDTVIRFDEPMRAHTYLGIGGNAAVYAKPQDLDLLKELLAFAKDEGLPVHYIGGGTNLLINDGPLKCMFISLAGMRGIDVVKEIDEEVYVKAWAGESLKGFLAYCHKGGFTGMEPLAGIPGSVGGAVKGNAGSFGREVKDLLASAEVLDATGELKTLGPDEMGFSYRGSGLAEGDLVLSAEFLLTRDEPGRIKREMEEYFQRKKNSQPLGARSAGCVFKNPEGTSAGKLLDDAGLKGAREGGIEVSTVHANFFVNAGGGTATDFLRLMDRAINEVLNRTGIVLEPEIRIVRDAGY